MIFTRISYKKKLLVLSMFLFSYFFSSSFKISNCKLFVNNDIYLAEVSSSFTSEASDQDSFDIVSFAAAEVSHSVNSLFKYIVTVYYVLFHSELPFIYSDLPPPGFLS